MPHQPLDARRVRDKLLEKTTYRGNRYLAALNQALTIAIKEWG
jgi:hypothetical protein